jgi:hypothetical protein
MKTRAFALILISILAVFVITNQAFGQSGGFIISGADAVVYIDSTSSPTLESLFPSVAPRFIVKYADSMKFINLVPIPIALQNLFGQIKDRFVIKYADANRYLQLGYPIGLVGDTDPPAIQNLALSKVWTVTWDTDELATGELFWGGHSSAYTQTISDTQYAASHQLQMIGLTPGATYYFIVKSADRSHNTAQSSEITFVADTSISGLTATNDGPTSLGNQTTITASISGGTNVVFSWNFGDGTSGSGKIVTHVYSTEGTHTATVTATNSVSTAHADTTVTIFKPVASHKLFIPLGFR